ncbi:hypothetical protein CKA32_003409 [Geitlerinema sp. FC II]|nr:hypothetical protein CKA32_003409 [Geitlerinema sp. FC II]
MLGWPQTPPSFLGLLYSLKQLSRLASVYLVTLSGSRNFR